MATDETLPYGRSPSRATRVVHDALAHEQRSFFGQKSSKNSQQKSASDKLLWFSPVHSPLLSPGREKTLQIAKKKVRHSSIFSIQNRAKGSIEAEEPTSPKVSCMGQVRAHKKEKDPFADTSKKKIPQSKPGSMSPARFFASPGRSSKWGSLFGSRRDSCATPSSSGYGGDASVYQAERHNTWAAVDDYFDRYARKEVGPDVFTEVHTSAGVNHKIPPNIGANEKSHIMHAQEKLSDTKKSNPHVEPCHADDYVGADKSLQEQRRHKKPPVSKQRLTYEELPSLHCGASAKQNMKISVEVVPETWLWRNGERLRPDSTSHLNSVPDRSASTSREELQNIQEEEVNTPASPPNKDQPSIREAEDCTDYPILPAQPDNTSSKTIITEVKSGFTSADAGFCPRDDTCNRINVENEKNNDTQHCSMDKSCQSHHVSVPPCTHMDAYEEKSREFRSSDSQDGSGGGKHQQAHVLLHGENEKNDTQHCSMDKSCQSHHVSVPPCTHMGAYEEKSREFRSSDSRDGLGGGKHQQSHVLLHGEKLKSEVDVEKHQFLWGSSEVKSGHRMLRRVGLDVGKQNYGLALPQLVEKKLPSVNSNEDGKRIWSIFKGRKSEAFSAQPFSALILVGYDQPIMSKSNDEELLKGILEVGRLSFHGAGKYFQVLKGDAEFIRSRSATSHRTVIRLQRCNSDPCRPSC